VQGVRQSAISVLAMFLPVLRIEVYAVENIAENNSKEM
jgi:hypothetical protein